MRLRSAATALLITTLAILSAASAQAQSIPASVRQPLSAASFVAAPGRGNYLMIEGATTAGHLTPSAALVIDYAYRPLVVYNARCTNPDGTNCTVQGTASNLVENLVSFQLNGSLTLFNRVQVGLVLPILVSTGDPYTVTSDSGPIVLSPGGTVAGLGDLRLNAKVNILGSDGIGVAVVVFGTLPSGNWTASSGNLGNRSGTVGGYAIGEFQRNGFRVSANAGGYWSDTTTFLSTTQGSRLTYGLGLGYDLTPLVGLMAERNGSASFANVVDENALEARLGARFLFDDFIAFAAVGPGLVPGVGVPVVRAVAGFQWAPNQEDRDTDGVLDRVDGCPTDPEDTDGYDDTDGCPELDNDGDGVPDATDECRDEPGEAARNGCSDSNADNDGDGILNGYDSCPDQPEDMDGDRDDDGCPDNDRDRDNIGDDVDQCPDQPEDTDGYGDEDGCPEEDFDSDGAPDDNDQCPDQAEDRDEFEDDDGCPEEGGPPAAADPEPGRRPRR